MKISTSRENIRFKNHLELNNNDRIIFSGIFGIGKTTFLNNFFQDNSSYECFKINPINYSISNSEDIIEYIKYDLIFELLSKNVDYKVENFPIELTSQFYIQENFVEVFSTIAKYGGKIGKTISNIVLDLKKLKNDIESHNKEHSIDEKTELIKFLKEINVKSGSIFEENHITLLISNLIESIKTTEKQSILIIDDLDRLDPEHIFRILNVFACHFDIDNTNNKFNIDKIIIVCDVENLRKIFSAKYGQQTDFSGYIDKFFSNEIFYYDSKKEISDNLTDILRSIDNSGNNGNTFNLNVPDYNNIKLLIINLKGLINCNAINLRTLFRLSGKKYELTSYHFTISEAHQNRASNKNFDLIMIFDFLSSIFGSKENLSQAINTLAKNRINKFVDSYEYYLFVPIVIFVDYKKHKLKPGKYEYSNSELDTVITYEIEKNGFSVASKINSILSKESGIQKDFFPYAEFLRIAFPLYQNLEIIN